MQRLFVMTYQSSGIRFNYPDDWILTEQWQDDDLTVTVSDGETAQWSITLLTGLPDPAEVLSEAVRAFEEEYTDLDLAESRVVLADYEAVAADVDFECFELLNSAFVRAFQTSQFTALVLYQATDHELKALQPQFDSINASLVCDPGMTGPGLN